MGRSVESERKMKRKTIAIIAPTGMLGNMAYRELKDTYSIILVYRDDKKLKELQKTHGSLEKHKIIKLDLNDIYRDYLLSFPTQKMGPHTARLINLIGPIDFIINCSGITKPQSLKNVTQTLFINGLFPNMLSKIYKEKLIQIATDCVFDGLSGAPYKENSPQFPNDLYGLSKSMGEPIESLVIRTSIIGPELTSSDLLLEWFKKQKNKTLEGFTNHLWNGITTKQFARICDQIIQHPEKFPKNGVFHIFSTSLTKYEMLKKFEEKYKINIRIEPVKAKIPVDRRLATKYDLCRKLKIPSFDEMLNDL